MLIRIPATPRPMPRRNCLGGGGGQSGQSSTSNKMVARWHYHVSKVELLPAWGLPNRVSIEADPPHEGTANPDPPHVHDTAPPGPNLMLTYSRGWAANRSVSAISRSLGKLSALDSLS